MAAAEYWWDDPDVVPCDAPAAVHVGHWRLCQECDLARLTLEALASSRLPDRIRRAQKEGR